MRVKVERNRFLKSLGRVHRVVERRNTEGLLSHMLLCAQDGSLVLRATNLEIEISECIEAEVMEGGTITVPAFLFYDIIRKLPEEGEILLNASSGSLSLVSGHANFNLVCANGEGFPSLSGDDFSCKFSLSAKDLKRLLDATRPAVSTDDTRYFLNGVYLHIEENEKLRAVATDAHRLALAQMPAPEGAIGMQGIIIPNKTLIELQKLLSEELEAELTLEISESKIQIRMGALLLISMLIDGVFPPYQRVIPMNNDKKVIVNRQIFSSAVDRVSTISKERGNAVKFVISQDEIKISVHNSDYGSADDSVSCSYRGEEITIGFNARYLIEIMSQLSSDDIVFFLAGTESSTLVRAEDDEDIFYVLMPMRV